MPEIKNIKHELFCIEFLVDLNATKAYLRVFKTKNEATARANSARLLAKANIQTRIDELKNERAERTKITADEVLKGIYTIANLDIAEIFDDDGNVRNINEIPEHIRRAISGVEINEIWEQNGKSKDKIGETKKIKMDSKLAAWRDLGRHLKLFTDKFEIGGTEELADRLSKARKRGKQS